MAILRQGFCVRFFFRRESNFLKNCAFWPVNRATAWPKQQQGPSAHHASSPNHASLYRRARTTQQREGLEIREIGRLVDHEWHNCITLWKLCKIGAIRVKSLHASHAQSRIIVDVP
jgi:hypothetical protein